MHRIEELRAAVDDSTQNAFPVSRLTNLLLLEIVERLEALRSQSLNAFDSDHAAQQCDRQKPEDAAGS